MILIKLMLVNIDSLISSFSGYSVYKCRVASAHYHDDTS